MELHLLQTLVVGIGCGFVVSVPVGPVNLTVVNNALSKGFLSAFLAGLGAIFAESIYAALMLAGHSTLLDQPKIAFAMRVVAVVVIAGMGVRSLLSKPDQVEAQSAAAAEKNLSQEQVAQARKQDADWTAAFKKAKGH